MLNLLKSIRVSLIMWCPRWTTVFQPPGAGKYTRFYEVYLVRAYQWFIKRYKNTWIFMNDCMFNHPQHFIGFLTCFQRVKLELIQVILIQIPKSFLCICMDSKTLFPSWYEHFLLPEPMYITVQLSTLNFICHASAQLSSLLTSSCYFRLSDSLWQIPNSFVVSKLQYSVM